jgi:hypothetical protein
VGKKRDPADAPVKATVVVKADEPEVRVMAAAGAASGKASRQLEPTLANLDALDVDSVVCGVCADVRPLAGLLGMIDWRLCGRISRYLQEGTVRGDDGEKVLLPSLGRIPSPRIFLYGWGPSTSLLQQPSARVAAMIEMVEKAGGRRVAFAFPEPARALLDVGGPQVEQALGDKLVALFAADSLSPV